MKLNKISMVIAAMAFVGCSSDDFDLSSNKAVDESGMIQLDENFVIAGVGEEGAATRTHWEWNNPLTQDYLINKFLPIYNAGAAAGQMLDVAADLEKQAVGLCWMGEAGGPNVYTNYEFYHFGWLNIGETKAKVACEELTNGAMYDEIGGLLAVTNLAGGDNSKEALPGTDWTIAELPAKAVKAGVDNLNYNSGVYKTDNKAIFGGQYIVYYPYNKNFQEVGTIPAIAKTTWNNVSTRFNTAEIGKETFRYSAPTTMEGGNRAANFGLYNLSSLVQLKVFAPTGDLALGDDIDKIVLYSPSKKLLKQVTLAADKIAAGQKGQALYATQEGTKTICATFGAVNALAVEGAATSAFITVLPTTVDDLVVFVHNNTDKTWATKTWTTTEEFKAGGAKLLKISVKASDFTTDYIAVDEPTLIAARNEARTDITTYGGKRTIKVIGDITLDGSNADVAATAAPFAPANYNFNNGGSDGNITYTGDAIIVPEDVKLNVNTNFVSTVRVLGKSCCEGNQGGRLYIDGGTLNNVTMEPTKATNVTPANYDALNPEVTYTYDGIPATFATIAANATFDVQAGNVFVNDAVHHKGNIKIAKDAMVTVNGTNLGVKGDLNFMGGSVVNNGTIEVMKEGKYDMTDNDGNATANDGKRMTNNGKFIHNVDAEVGTAVQSMIMDPNVAEYRCRVDKQIKLDDALLQWTACSVIEMVNTVNETYDLGTGKSIALLGIGQDAYKHNGKFIDFEINDNGAGATSTFIKHPTVNDNEEIMVGNLTVTSGSLIINYPEVVTATAKYQRKLKVNGDMKVYDNTTITTSKKITVTKNLTVDGPVFTYAGNKANQDGLAVDGNITVDHAGTFDAGAGFWNALNITCANFYLKNASRADFGNRTDGDAWNMKVTGTIDNPAGCTFNIVGANQNGLGSVYAWVECKALKVGGTFPGARPKVVE